METPEQYLYNHPEIKLLISIFTAECVHQYPFSIRRFAASFFSNYALQRYVANSFGYEDGASHVKAYINEYLEKINARQSMRRIDQEQARMVQIVGYLRAEIESELPSEDGGLARLLEKHDELPEPPHDQALRLSGILHYKHKAPLQALSTSNLLLNGAVPDEFDGAVDVQAYMQLSSVKVKLVQLAEFAYKAMDFTKFKDLGNAFLVFPPLRDYLAQFSNIATRPVLYTAFPRALTVQTANSVDYDAYTENLQLFYCHVQGVGLLELLHGPERLLQRFPATLFICTNHIVEHYNIDSELRYFAGIGKNIRYLASKSNQIQPRYYSYLPVLLKGNYKQQQVEDFCVILVSFVPNCHFEREYCFRKQIFYEEKYENDNDGDNSEISDLETVQFGEMPHLLPLNAKSYSEIVPRTIEELREVGVNIDAKNVVFMNIGVYRVCSFDGEIYDIMKTLVDPLPTYDNPNWEFWFDTVVNSMDNRNIDNYEQTKIEQIKCFYSRQDKNIFSQIVSFKNMTVTNGKLRAYAVTKQEIRDVSYIEPLMYYIDQCLKLSSGIGMIYDAKPMPQFKLLAGHFFKRLTASLNIDPVLVYIANTLNRYTVANYSSKLEIRSTSPQSPPSPVYIFSYQCLVGHGPLFECADIFHSLNCKNYCQCSHDYLGSSQFYFSSITAENVLTVLPGIKTHGELFKAKITLGVLLKALVFHYYYNIFNQTFAAQAPSFPYMTTVGFYYNYEEPQRSFLYDQEMFRAKVLAYFQYYNVNGNMLSNVFLHYQAYLTPQEDAANSARIQDSALAGKTTIILDYGCFGMCQIAYALKRFGVVMFENLGHLKEVVFKEVSQDAESYIDVDMCYPCSLVTHPVAYQHVQLLCRSIYPNCGY